jgi:hypothetical protein
MQIQRSFPEDFHIIAPHSSKTAIDHIRDMEASDQVRFSWEQYVLEQAQCDGKIAVSVTGYPASGDSENQFYRDRHSIERNNAPSDSK